MTFRLRLALGLILAALVWAGPVVSPPAKAQDSLRQVDETGALVPRQGPGLPEQAAPVEVSASLDYAAWERLAERAEKATSNRNIGSEALEAIRRQMVDWRSALLGEQNANAARIATLRTQIAALGPAPADGVPEVEEIANRRAALTEQLVTLQAPGLAAEEAYRRADGLTACCANARLTSS
jgi:small-conductance mechanosensitive channel